MDNKYFANLLLPEFKGVLSFYSPWVLIVIHIIHIKTAFSVFAGVKNQKYK